MNHQTPLSIHWRGQVYLVTCTCDPGEETATVSPENVELQNTIVQSLKSKPGFPLAVYKGFHGDYLTDDPKQGEA